MKILLSNKFYYRRGGDCIYMLNLEQMLKAHGHEVAVFAMDYPENLDTPWQKYFPQNMSKLMAFTRPFGSAEVKSKFNRLLDGFRPDVVHLNNIHTHLSPVIAELAHRRGIRVVWTLHDYKLLCPRYDCLLNGTDACEACFNGNKKPCLVNKCMKGSKLASWIGYKEAQVWNRERLGQCTDVFICPSRFMHDKMVQGGFNPSKLQTLCNFIDTEKCRRADNYAKADYYCYVGRLSHEKGVETLIKAARQSPHKLVVVGSGPLEDQLRDVARDTNIEFVGHRAWDDLKVIVGQARFTVIPSECYENNPLSVIEAECLGTPVLGARIGGIPELIEEGVSGMTFESRNVDDLRQKIAAMWQARFDYAGLAEKAIMRYDAETYYKRLQNIYLSGKH